MPGSYDEFNGLYSAVTAELRQFVAVASRLGEATQEETDWFRAIIDGFTQEFALWPTTTQPHIRSYLDLFETTSSRILRVAGHAFLHIAYDLPRVLANHMTFPGTDRSRLRDLFVRPAPLLRQVFREHVRDGGLGLLLRPFGAAKPVEILAYWVIALRSVAWIHAEILADNPGIRPRLEKNLAEALFVAGEAARKKFWVLGVPRMELSRLFQISPAP